MTTDWDPEYPLMPLMIPSGWEVVHNEFRDIELTEEEEEENDDLFFYLYDVKDMLLLSKGEYALDLGWSGGEEEGYYCIHFFKGSWNKGELLEVFSSRDKNKIAARINDILAAFERGDFNSLTGYLVDGDDPDNSSAFSDKMEDWSVR